MNGSSPWPRRSVSLPEDLWRRLKCARHRQHIDKFNEALRLVVEAGLNELENRPAPQAEPRKRRGRRAIAKAFALLTIGAGVAGWWQESSAEMLRAEAQALDYLVLAEDLYDFQQLTSL
jgi:ferric-dicitrate binding protein FerR (iron transport regulator)